MDEKTIIKEAINILTASEQSNKRFHAVIESLEARLIRSERNVYRLGVIGVTSSGKSTMINSLLGEPLLPSGARPSSSRLVSCHKGPNKKVNIIFENNEIKSFNKPTADLLSKYGDEKYNHNNKEKVKQIEIIMPSFPLDESIVLVDSPGLDAYGFASHEELTMNSMLPTIDFCIFVTTCKSNSDEKMLSVLNTIASYDKPVIIVQNMIDSIKSSVDGKETASMIAQKNKNRVERIITKSDIADKSKVCVVQISAIWALKAKESKDKDLLDRSNYNLLIKQINKSFENLKPSIIGHRMALLKREFQRISQDILADATAKNTMPMPAKFEFEGIKNNIDSMVNDSVESIKNEIEKFKNFYESRFTTFDAVTGIKMLNKYSKDCKNCFVSKTREINKHIEAIGTKLNVDSRDLFSRIEIEAINIEPSTRVEQQTRTEHIQHHTWEDSSWGIKRWAGRVFGKSWTEDRQVVTGTKVVVDRKKSILNGRKMAGNFILAMNKAVKDWLSSLNKTIKTLYAEIDRRHSEWNARIKYAEDASKFKEIGLKLKRLSDSIVVKNSKSSTVHQNTDYKKEILSKINVNMTTMAIYSFSRQINFVIHKNTIQLFTKSDDVSNIIIGWDQTSEAMFCSIAFGYSLSKENELAGLTHVKGDVWLYHNGKNVLKAKRSSNFFVLVNALQIGSAKKQIQMLRLDESLNHNGKLYFVIQDLQEVINAGVLDETMDDLYSLGRDLEIKHSYAVLSNHINPIYNLALVAASERKGSTQSDEISIIHMLQSRFSYLFPAERQRRTEMENEIKNIIYKTLHYGKINSYSS